MTVVRIYLSTIRIVANTTVIPVEVLFHINTYSWHLIDYFFHITRHTIYGHLVILFDHVICIKITIVATTDLIVNINMFIINMFPYCASDTLMFPTYQWSIVIIYKHQITYFHVSQSKYCIQGVELLLWRLVHKENHHDLFSQLL